MGKFIPIVVVVANLITPAPNRDGKEQIVAIVVSRQDVRLAQTLINRLTSEERKKFGFRDNVVALLKIEYPQGEKEFVVSHATVGIVSSFRVPIGSIKSKIEGVYSLIWETETFQRNNVTFIGLKLRRLDRDVIPVQRQAIA